MDLLLERHEERSKREESFVGLLASALMNPHRGKQRPILPEDLFPRLKPEPLTSRELFEKLKRGLKAKPREAEPSE